MMTLYEILEVDAKRNHPSGTSADYLLNQIKEDAEKGGKLLHKGKVLICFRCVADGVMETHSFNAGTASELLEANKSLWRKFKDEGFKTVQTQYENPKINVLLETVMGEFDISISIKDERFEMKVSL
jgi:hypothetical protein